MILVAAVEQAQAYDSREAGMLAARQALERTGRTPALLAWVIAGQDYALQSVLAGVASVLGDTPLIGFSSSGPLTGREGGRRSVVVALLAGTEVQVRADWQPGFIEDSLGCTNRLIQSLLPGAFQGSGLFLVADGVNGDAQLLCQALPTGNYMVAGCLAGGDLTSGRTYQLGGRQAGSGGLAGAWLSGQIAFGVGVEHGWQSAGLRSRITRVQGMWLRTLNDRKPAEVYADQFGIAARDWSFPPLNHLVRLYPLGLESDASKDLLVRVPLHMEADGSLRMNTSLPEGEPAYLMISSIEGCLEAARRAARQALQTLGQARPVLALILADVAWQMLLEAFPGKEVQAIREVLGPEVAIAGGYGLGQIARPRPGAAPQLLNGSLEVLLIGSNA